MTKKATVKNLDAVMARLVAYAVQQQDEARKAFCDDLNRFLDNILNDDGFGTEGQTDPRGDQRG